MLFFSGILVFANNAMSNCSGGAKVPVANCNEERSYSHPKSDMKFSEFVGYMQKLNSSDCGKEKPVLYLKDWHCQRHASCLLCVVATGQS